MSIIVTDVSKKYPLRDRNSFYRFIKIFFPLLPVKINEFYALKDISFKLQKGEILGVVGRNGAGKSTLLKVISGVSMPTTGTVKVNGSVEPLLELGSGLNAEFTGRENIYFKCSLNGLNKLKIKEIIDEIIDFSELNEFIDTPVKRYSSGMKARLGFSISIHLVPDIIILDEVLAVGDELFKRKCFAKMREVLYSGKTVIYVSHNSQSIIDICDRAILLHNGELVMDADPKRVISAYKKILSLKNSKQQNVFIRSLKELDKKDEIQSENTLDENLIEISKKNTNDSKKRDITLIETNILQEESKEKVNILKEGLIYVFYFKLSLTENYRDCIFSISITDKRQVSICGTQFSLNSPELHFVDDNIVEIRLAFKNHLVNGLYGTKIVIKDDYKGKENYFQAVDSILFRVDENNSLGIKGKIKLLSLENF